jgi:hypothetical protein
MKIKRHSEEIIKKLMQPGGASMEQACRMLKIGFW